MNKIDNIWLIDDDMLFRICTEVLVKDNGIVENMKLFDSATSAVELLKSKTLPLNEIPDVIFVDLNMPVMGGWDFLEMVIKLNLVDTDKTIIYILSSSLDPRDFEKAKTYRQISGFVPKPLTPNKFSDLIEEVKQKFESIL